MLAFLDPCGADPEQKKMHVLTLPKRPKDEETDGGHLWSRKLSEDLGGMV